jgi:FKBP-type peptidyl-prolyl cis-trans isomerase SlyD
MKVEENKIVGIEYEVYDNETKELVDKNTKDNLLEFLVGAKNIVPGLESALIGMAVTETKSITVAPEDAYGPYSDDALEEVPVEQFEGIDLQEGMTLYAKDEQGQSIPAIVKTIGTSNVLVDYNHPLAGKILNFTVEIVEIRDASQNEKDMGHPEAKNSGGGCCGGGGCGDSSSHESEAESTGCCSN